MRSRCPGGCRPRHAALHTPHTAHPAHAKTRRIMRTQAQTKCVPDSTQPTNLQSDAACRSMPRQRRSFFGARVTSMAQLYRTLGCFAMLTQTQPPHTAPSYPALPVPCKISCVLRLVIYILPPMVRAGQTKEAGTVLQRDWYQIIAVFIRLLGLRCRGHKLGRATVQAC